MMTYFQTDKEIQLKTYNYEKINFGNCYCSFIEPVELSGSKQGIISFKGWRSKSRYYPQGSTDIPGYRQV